MKRVLYIGMIPALSMTFVYREVQALREAGYEIKTVSRGTPNRSQISDEALPFYKATLYLDQVSLVAKVYAQWKVLCSKPREWFSLIGLIMREKEYNSLRDVPRSLYHFLEAGYLYTKFDNDGISQIHAHILNAPTSIALFLSRYLGIPFSFTMHGSRIYVDPLMLRTKLILCKKAVTTSEFNRNFLLKKYGNQFADKIVVIHCGVDVNVFKPQSQPKAVPPIILAVGRLAEVKGLRYLLEACSILKRKGLAFQCQIVGDGEELGLLTKRQASLGIEGVVSFRGSQPQEIVRKLLQEASIFVLPSIVADDGVREGIPVALMEAMAIELPVLSTKTVGIPELIADKKHGLLVEQKNSIALASALEFLLRNPAVGQKMGRSGRTKIIRDFNIAHLPARFDPVFN